MRLLVFPLSCFLLAVVAATPAHAQTGRDYIYIVGSSTVYPFATIVAERFGRRTDYRTPKVESTGSGGGFKLFCDGVGVNHPDVSNASRAIKPSELEGCATNGVGAIIEVKIGYDGIVFAKTRGGDNLALNGLDLYRALAKWVPAETPGELMENPYQLWSEVNPSLPATPIEVLGPPPTSGTRDVLVETTLEAGCLEIDWLRGLMQEEPDRFRQICHTIREDGRYIEAGENDNLIVQKLEANPNAVGIFGFSFLDQNRDRLKAASVNGILPGFNAIASGEYPISRPLYFYVKKTHINLIPGLRSFLRELTSERTWGDEGYLSERGLIPMPGAERRQVAEEVSALTPLRFAGRPTLDAQELP